MTTQVFTGSVTGKSFSIPIAFYYLLAVGLYAITFSYWQHQPIPHNVHVAATLLAATCLLPIFIWRAQGSNGLPMFELICLSYIVQFSAPAYILPNQVIIFSRPILLGWEKLYEVLLYTECGIIAMLISYYLTRNSTLITNLPKLELRIQSEQTNQYLRFALFLGGIFLGLTALNLVRSAAIGAVARLLASQFYIAVVIIAYNLYQQKTTERFWSRVLLVAVIYSFTIGLITGMLENALTVLVLLLIVRWHAMRQIPWHWLLTGILLFFVLNGAKGEYRRQVWFGNAGQASVVGKVMLWADLAAESAVTLWSDRSGDRQEFIDSTLSRFDLIHRFAYVSMLTPSVVPYYGGESYTYFFVAWIPRFVWPNKPVATNVSQRMDLDYRLKNKNDPSSIGIGLLPEAYANFGISGVIVILAIQGAIFAGLNSLLNSANSEGGRAIYLTIMIYFLNGIGSAAATQFGNIFQQVIAHSILLYPFVRQQRTTTNK